MSSSPSDSLSQPDSLVSPVLAPSSPGFMDRTVGPPPLERFTEEEVASFNRNGFVIVRQLADAQTREQMLAVTLDGVTREIEPIEYEADVQYPGAPSTRTATGGRTARRLKQAQSRHTAFTQWACDPRVTNRLRQLLGNDLVMPLVHHNCIMTKQPQFSSDTGWHQDVRYWSFLRPDLVSVWLALGCENSHNGCLQVIPGTHDMQFARDRMDEALFLREDLPVNQELMERRIPVELQPGDVLFFHARTFHAASRNFSSDPKFSVVYTYRPADNTPLPGTRSGTWPELLIPGSAGQL